MRILVVCHDAGASEIISSYVQTYKTEHEFVCVAGGPAVQIFERKGLQELCKPFPSSAQEVLGYMDHPDLVLTGTSWTTDRERSVIVEAKNQGFKTAVYLDHWVNYRERFGYPTSGWEKNVPDELWVGDTYAREVAEKEGFQNIRLVPNLYFEALKQEIEEERKRQKKKKNGATHERNVLFISEPIAQGALHAFGDPHYWGYTEYEVLEALCRCVKNGSSIIIRRHPADPPNIYDEIIVAYRERCPLQYSEQTSLVSDIVRSDVIVGMDSMALVVGVFAGKQVVSFIPSAKKICSLPFEEIIRLTDEGALCHIVQSVSQ